jgi:hypothetical protein
MLLRFVMRLVDPTLPRYSTDLMTLQFELLHESSLAFAAASLILTRLQPGEDQTVLRCSRTCGGQRAEATM